MKHLKCRWLVLSALMLVAPLVSALTPPASWKGINYFPRRHQFYNMLNDWYGWDSTAGQYVYQSVNSDLTLLSQNGFNFVHLYLWDESWFGTGFNAMCGVTTHGQTGTGTLGFAWRQTRTPAAGWQNLSFDDSAWGSAVDEGALGTSPWGTLGFPSGSLARWIWDYDSRAGSDTNTVYFRRKFYTAQASQTLAITADNSFVVYVNGTQVGSGNNWQTVYSFPVTLNTGATGNVIAVQVTNGGGPGGFIADLRGSLDPAASPNSQWAALDDYLTKAEANGIHVGLHFVSNCPIDLLNGGIGAGGDLTGATQMGNQFTTWANRFINYFAPRHGNILLWGMPFALGPIPDVGGRSNPWNEFFATAYQGVAPVARGTAPQAGLGRVGINLDFRYLGSPDGYSYSWDWQRAQRAAQTLRDIGGASGDADVYMVQLYNANSANIERDLRSLTTTGSSGGLIVPVDKLLAVEFATSSSLAPSPNGNGVPSSGDADTPTSDLAGHSQWLTNALCAYQRAGLSKLAYWALYDSADFWQAPPFNQTGEALAWNGYWGLYPLPQGGAAKPAWATLTNYYRYGSLSCSQPAPPVLTLIADKTSVAAGQPLKLTWTAADVTSLNLTGVGTVSKSLDSRTISASGSGAVTYTLTGWNGSVQRTASVTVTVTGGGASCEANPPVGAGNSNASNAGYYDYLCGYYRYNYGTDYGYCATANSYAAAAGVKTTATGTCSGGTYYNYQAGLNNYYCRYYENQGYGWNYNNYCTTATSYASSGGCTGCGGGGGGGTSYTLSVSRNGSGSGTVTSSPAGINCGATCSASFSSGTMVTLTASPASGSSFAGWSGAGCSGTGNCTVTMNAAQSVTATFNAATVYYTLSVGKNGSGGGTVTSSPAGISCGGTCAASFAGGTYVTLSASADSGSSFAGWSGGGCSGTGGCTVLMNAAQSVTATFNTNGPVITSVTDSNYSSTLYPWSTIIVWGSGFTPSGGNTVQLMRSGYADVWLYEGDGHYYWDYSSGQINSSLDYRAASGWWTVVVRNASSWPSAGYSIYIQ